MKKFYTNVSQVGNYIYHRYIDENGKRLEEYTDFVDIDLFIPSREETPYKTFYGNNPLHIKSFAKIKDARDFVKKYSDTSNMKIHGNQNWWAQFIAKEYPLEITYDVSKLVIANIDIETSMTFDNGETGFPEPEKAPSKVTAITVEINNHYTVFGSKEYTGDLPKNAEHIQCHSEEDLLQEFLTFWQQKKPDIITGWNIEGFDIPYLINRITKLLGYSQACRLSPAHRFLKDRSLNIREKRLDNGKVIKDYAIHGTAISDLLKLYKFYTFKMRERYSLDFIGHVELGQKKLDYEEVKNTFELLETSENVSIPKDKTPDEMEEFVRWCRIRNILREEKSRRCK